MFKETVSLYKGLMYALKQTPAISSLQDVANNHSNVKHRVRTKIKSTGLYLTATLALLLDTRLCLYRFWSILESSCATENKAPFRTHNSIWQGSIRKGHLPLESNYNWSIIGLTDLVIMHIIFNIFSFFKMLSYISKLLL